MKGIERLRSLPLFILFLLAIRPAAAEMQEIHVAQQYGINYLQLMVMEDQHLIEKQAKAAGLGNVKVDWTKFGGGNVMNDALLSGRLQFASGGIGPMITLWDRTHEGLGVRGVAAINSMPVVLNTRNPHVKTIKDFTVHDKIALPAVKVSIQAVTLEMAAAKAFGDNQYARLDPLTVSLSHPDGMTALLSGQSEIDSHFTGPPFSELELQKPGIHTVVHSYHLLGGKTTSTLVWTTSKFRNENPKLYKAFVAALNEATQWINADKKAAAKLYVRRSGSKGSASSIYKILMDPDIEYTLTPMKVKTYADFMCRVKSIKHQPASWKDLFFPNVYALPGS